VEGDPSHDLELDEDEPDDQYTFMFMMAKVNAMRCVVPPFPCVNPPLLCGDEGCCTQAECVDVAGGGAPAHERMTRVCHEVLQLMSA
jgi:hypothetical protein